jgi:hypothetical protein
MFYSHAAAGRLERAAPAAVLPPDWPGSILAFSSAGNLLFKTVEHTYQLDLQD